MPEATHQAGGDVDLTTFLDDARRIADAMASMPPRTRWLVDCDTDADGVCGAAVMTWALRRLGHQVHVRPSRRKDTGHYVALRSESWDGLVLVDKGSSHLTDLLPPRPGDTTAAGSDPGPPAANEAPLSLGPVFVVDHHNIGDIPDGIHVVNPRRAGLDGSRHASASTTAYAVALALHGDAAVALAPAALAGAIGDWQHRPSWEGWNRRVLEDASTAGAIRHVVRPRLIGLDLGEAATRLGWSRAWVESLALDPSRDAEDLDRTEQTRLASALALSLLARGDPAMALSRVVGPTYVDAADRPLRLLFRTVDACGRLGHAGTGIAYLHNDPHATLDAQAHLAEYRSRIVVSMDTLMGSLHEQAGLRWGDITDAAMTGMVAGLAIESGRVPADSPLAVFAPRPDERLQVSTRTVAACVDRGVDLGRATSEAASAVGAEGGGHPVAAGAVIDASAKRAFLERLAALVVTQGDRTPETAAGAPAAPVPDAHQGSPGLPRVDPGHEPPPPPPSGEAIGHGKA